MYARDHFQGFLQQSISTIKPHRTKHLVLTRTRFVLVFIMLYQQVWEHFEIIQNGIAREQHHVHVALTKCETKTLCGFLRFRHWAFLWMMTTKVICGNAV